MLEAGTRLGPYEIQAPLGAGGMGEVYRARDTRLDRTVAIKILPPQFAGDPSLRERFDREARLISSLSHPHICSLFDVGEHDGVAFLVVEHLEGETLAARLEKGRLPLEQALKIAVQLAGALDAAHRAGVVHRDVKPGNVMLTKAGAKLLDFGLARSEPLLSAVHGSSLLPTTPAVTAQGTILGTLQYMSPEQLDGVEADARSDTFAFGALVYEMVSGRKAFEGKTQASLIAAIMSADPPSITTLQPVAPAALDRVIRKCLAKDPDERWQSAKDLGDELNWIARAETAPHSHVVTSAALSERSHSNRERLLWAVALLLGAAVIAAFVMLRTRLFSPADAPVVTYRTSILLPQGASMETVAPGRRVGLSPDGRYVAFLAINPDRMRLIWLRPIDSMTAQPIAGTEGAGNVFWSPDSKYIGFVAQGRLKKIELAGGPPVTIAPEASAVGGTWNRDGVIVYARRSWSLYQVNATGGTPVAVIEAQNKTDLLSDPAFLSDGRHFLYQVSQLAGGGERNGVYVGSLEAQDQPKRLLSISSNALASQGYLLYARDRALIAQPFDEARLELSGTATVIGEGLEIGSSPVSASFSVSNAGSLAFRTGAVGVRTQLTWFDRKGVQQGTVGEAADDMTVSLSPDGSRVAVSGLDAARNTRDLWIVDVARKLRTRFTFDAADDLSPVWSADGRTIYFASRRSGRLDIFSKPASGEGTDTQLLTDNQNNLYPSSASADGRFLIYFTGNALTPTGNDLWALPLTGDPKPKVFVQTEFNETYAVFSPDGRWVAYTSGESGHSEVYVASFPGLGGKWQVSQDGGSYPRWRGDSAELYFISPEGPLMAASVDGRGSAFVVGQVTPLFRPRIRSVGFAGTNANNYDVTRDGQRFLVAVSESSPTETPITLVVNWTTALE